MWNNNDTFTCAAQQRHVLIAQWCSESKIRNLIAGYVRRRQGSSNLMLLLACLLLKLKVCHLHTTM